MQPKKFSTIDIIVLLGSIVSGALALLIIWNLIFIAKGNGSEEAATAAVDKLDNLAGVIIGFYFGSFTSLVRDYLQLKYTGHTSHSVPSSGVSNAGQTAPDGEGTGVHTERV